LRVYTRKTHPSAALLAMGNPTSLRTCLQALCSWPLPRCPPGTRISQMSQHALGRPKNNFPISRFTPPALCRRISGLTTTAASSQTPLPPARGRWGYAGVILRPPLWHLICAMRQKRGFAWSTCQGDSGAQRATAKTRICGSNRPAVSSWSFREARSPPTQGFRPTGNSAKLTNEGR
jgi:hypothetical protein